MDLLNVLHNMPKNSIYALINEQRKEIFLTYSYDVLSGLTRLINEIKSGIGLPIDPSEFKYKLLETVAKREDIKFRFNYWYDTYKQSDYKFYNKRKPINYKLISTIEKDFRNKTKRLLYVKLKNKHCEVTLGVFNNIEECNDFIDNYGDLYKIKHASNKLTKEYLNVK